MTQKQSKWLNPIVCVPGRRQSDCCSVISSGYRSQALRYTESDQRDISQYGIHDPTQHSVLGTRVRYMSLPHA